MKTSKVGIVAVVVLLVATGIGFGTAQAESRPVLSFEDQGLPQVVKSPIEDMQIENPVETGILPSQGNADSFLTEYGGIPYRAGIDTGP